MKQIIECVPNFSTSDAGVVEELKYAISSGGGKILDVDIDKNYNRTVVTFVGNRRVVMNSIMSAAREAIELIDMRYHQGEHPRIGAVDVVPFVPIQGVSMAHCAELAHDFGEKVWSKLQVPVYFYEKATPQEQAMSEPLIGDISQIRKEEYEGLKNKIESPCQCLRPYYCPLEFTNQVAKSGAIIIGAREPLIAYNVNLLIEDKRVASEIAGRIRESGRKINGRYKPGLFKYVKAIGVSLEDKGITQVSMNLTNYKAMPMYAVYEAIKMMAKNLEVEVGGSEIVGLVPKDALVSSGMFYRAYPETEVSEERLIKFAVMGLGLNNDFQKFDPEKKIIEYLI